MNDWLKENAISIIMALATLVSTYAVYGYRLSALEAGQDRQGIAITALQTSIADVQTQYAALNAKIDAIDSNVNYIRSRIDSAR